MQVLRREVRSLEASLHETSAESEASLSLLRASSQQEVGELRVDLACCQALERIQAEMSATRVKVAVPSVTLAEPANLDELTRFLNEDYNGNRIIIDCSPPWL